MVPEVAVEVGWAVGRAVGPPVGAVVGAVVGLAVGDAVGTTGESVSSGSSPTTTGVALAKAEMTIGLTTVAPKATVATTRIATMANGSEAATRRGDSFLSGGMRRTRSSSTRAPWDGRDLRSGSDIWCFIPIAPLNLR
jgi:hypothetical protein